MGGAPPRGGGCAPSRPSAFFFKPSTHALPTLNSKRLIIIIIITIILTIIIIAITTIIIIIIII